MVTGTESHPILKGLGTDWPVLLGYNEVTVKDGAEVLATFRPSTVHSHCWSPAPTARAAPSPGPPMSVRIGCRRAFIAWPGYKTLFEQMLAWATAKA